MNRPPVAFADSVALTIRHLLDQLPDYGWDVPVRKNVPNPRPASFVRVIRSGGVSRDVVVDEAMLIIECWASTDEDAADLATVVRALLNAMHGTVVDDVQCYRVREVSGPADLPDGLSDQVRLTWMVTVETRGTELSPTS